MPLNKPHHRHTRVVGPGHVPNNMFMKCPACNAIVYRKQVIDNLHVCPCGYHLRLTARQWLDLLVGESFVEEDAELAPCDPLGFATPQSTYSHKLAESQQRTGLNDAMISGHGAINGRPIQIAVCEFSFIGGSMGSVVGEKLARAAERAAMRQVPLITVNSSGGARMQEGLLSLMQMAKVSVAFAMLAAAGQPHISILTNPCYGGVTASYASVADIIIAEPGAEIGFAGKRVIQQTIRQQLPNGFQTAEFLLAHGMVDMVVARSDLRHILARTLSLYVLTGEDQAYLLDDPVYQPADVPPLIDL